LFLRLPVAEFPTVLIHSARRPGYFERNYIRKLAANVWGWIAGESGSDSERQAAHFWEGRGDD